MLFLQVHFLLFFALKTRTAAGEGRERKACSAFEFACTARPRHEHQVCCDDGVVDASRFSLHQYEYRGLEKREEERKVFSTRELHRTIIVRRILRRSDVTTT